MLLLRSQQVPARPSWRNGDTEVLEFTKNDFDLLNLYQHIVLIPLISAHLELYIDRAIHVQFYALLALMLPVRLRAAPCIGMPNT